MQMGLDEPLSLLDAEFQPLSASRIGRHYVTLPDAPYERWDKEVLVTIDNNRALRRMEPEFDSSPRPWRPPGPIPIKAGPAPNL